MKTPKISYIRPVEKAAATLNVVSIAVEHRPDDAILKTLCDDAKSKAEELLANMGDKHQKPLTEQLQELDAFRDSMIRALYHRLKSESFLMTDPAHIEAAEDLLAAVFGDRLSGVDLPLLRETAWINERVGLLTGDLAAKVEILGIGGIVTSLTQANDAFGEAYQARSSAQSEMPRNIMEFVPALNEALVLLCTYIATRFPAKYRDATFDPLNKVTKAPGKNVNPPPPDAQ
ncbi:hypothetical protein KKF84_08190 [Myxococcota bacterium]|nr:hypothetical protein [Myxococcota bacterium]